MPVLQSSLLVEGPKHPSCPATPFSHVRVRCCEYLEKHKKDNCFKIFKYTASC